MTKTRERTAPADHWPRSPAAVETAARIRYLLAVRGLTVRDVLRKAQERTPLSPQMVAKALRGGGRQGAAGQAVRWALKQLLRDDAEGLFDTVDLDNAG